jgi:hypothetical protein
MLQAPESLRPPDHGQWRYGGAGYRFCLAAKAARSSVAHPAAPPPFARRNVSVRVAGDRLAHQLAFHD